MEKSVMPIGFGTIGGTLLQRVGETIADDKKTGNELTKSQAMADFVDFMEFSEIRC